MVFNGTKAEGGSISGVRRRRVLRHTHIHTHTHTHTHTRVGRSICGGLGDVRVREAFAA